MNNEYILAAFKFAEIFNATDVFQPLTLNMMAIGASSESVLCFR